VFRLQHLPLEWSLLSAGAAFEARTIS